VVKVLAAFCFHGAYFARVLQMSALCLQYTSQCSDTVCVTDDSQVCPLSARTADPWCRLSCVQIWRSYFPVDRIQ